MTQNYWSKEQSDKWFARWEQAEKSGEVRKLSAENWYDSMIHTSEDGIAYLASPICSHDENGFIETVGWASISVNEGEGKPFFRLDQKASAKGF